jgi:hypothetical protein
MKINVCDVCRSNATGDLVASRYRSGFSGGMKVDLCQEHRHWASHFKNNGELAKAYIEMTERMNQAPKTLNG